MTDFDKPDSDLESLELDLDRAELAGPTGPTGSTGPAEVDSPELACAQCSLPIAELYYTAGEAVLCERCRGLAQEAWSQASGAGRLLRALAFGTGAAVLGAALWALVVQLTGYEVGLIAIVVGFLVGGGVRLGTRGRGGLGYQLMAVGLTYLAIISSYVPFVIQGLQQASAEEAAAGEGALSEEEIALLLEEGAPELYGEEAESAAAAAAALEEPPTLLQYAAGWGLVLLIAAAAPFLAGFQNLIGLLIIGIALWQAWKMNARAELELAGPFRVGASG